ncbi:MAG: OsmC family protein [Flavobacteriaceae bacterium]|nr:OsmC family protein [Flavobacteriaceae bacterium]
MSNIVKTVWKGDMTFESTNPGGMIVMDASKDIGGNDNGLRPKAMMLASLAGCSGIDIAMLVKKMRVKLDTFDIDITGELTEEHPRYYDKVVVDYNFYGNELDQTKIKRIVDLSVEKYCGVMEMFRRFAKVTVNIHYHEKE